MPYINKENLIGWYSGEVNYFLCDECFAKEKDIKKDNYEPVFDNELDGEHLYICDNCGERFE